MKINQCISHHNPYQYKGGVSDSLTPPQKNGVSESLAQLQKNNNLQNNSVSFQGAEKFLQSKTLHNVLNFASNNQATCLATVALFLGGILRPATILALPGKGKEDKQYASGHSIASAIIGFAFTSILLKPVSDPIKQIGKEPWNLFCDLDDKTKKYIDYIKKDPGKSIDDVEKEVIQFLNRDNKDPNKLITLKDYAKPEYKYLFADATDLVQKNKKLLNGSSFTKSYQDAIKNGNIKKAATILKNAVRESSEVFDEMVGTLNANSNTLFGLSKSAMESMDGGVEKAIDSALEDKAKPFTHITEGYEKVLDSIDKVLKDKKRSAGSLDTVMEGTKKLMSSIDETMPKVLMSSGKAFRNWKGFGTASKIMNLGIDFMFAVPKAILTVALNPPILKYIFHVEKPKKNAVASTAAMPSMQSAVAFNNFLSQHSPKLSAFDVVKGGAK